MPLPLPIDPTFRKEIVTFWIEDIEDRIEMGHYDKASECWQIANDIYLSLPPGSGDPYLEDSLYDLRVKLDKLIDI